MGCEWIGEYGKIENHLNFDNEKGECQFVAVKCPLSVCCECTILRKNLMTHCKICKYRQFTCKYCGFISTYEDVTTCHYNDCMNFPMQCPNHCSRMTYLRCQLKDHIAECPEENIPCTFNEMGCKEIVKRQMLQKHLDNSAVMHQMVMCQTITEQTQKLALQTTAIEGLERDKNDLEIKVHDLLQNHFFMQDTIQALEEDKRKLEKTVYGLTKEVHTLKSSSSDGNWINSWRLSVLSMRTSNWPLYLSKMDEISAIEAIVPVIFKASLTVTKIISRSYGGYRRNHHHHYSAPSYCSPPFYSHHNGYKLCLSAKVVCHCPSCCKSSIPHSYSNLPSNWYHSDRECYEYDAVICEDYFSLSVELSLTRGEYDCKLKWPFEKCVTVSLLNEKCSNGHTSIKNVYKGKKVGLNLTIKSSTDLRYNQIGQIKGTDSEKQDTLSKIVSRLNTVKSDENQLWEIQGAYIAANPNCILFPVKAGYDRDYQDVDIQPPSYYGDRDLGNCIGERNYHFYLEITM